MLLITEGEVKLFIIQQTVYHTMLLFCPLLFYSYSNLPLLRYRPDTTKLNKRYGYKLCHSGFCSAFPTWVISWLEVILLGVTCV